MTKFASLLFLAAAAVAQPAVNTTVLEQIAQAFTSAGFTQLAAAVGSIQNNTAGSQLLSIVTNGDSPFTIFAPTNSALERGNQTILGNPDSLAAILSYHVVSGSFGNSSLYFNSPNNTILRTYLNATDFTSLGNARQVISANVRNGTIFINNQNGTLEVANSTTVGRFSVLEIPRVLTPPASLATVAGRQNLTLFATAVQQAGLLDTVANAKGLTIFAPTDEALQAALTSLGDQAMNVTLIQTILQNHIINGTAVYSSEFDEKNFTSAAGEPINFFAQGDTLNVYSGAGNNITAKVTRRDVLTSNGVIHIIDGVLANTNRNDGAASSAYESATNSANDAQPTGGNDNGGNGGAPVGGGPNDQPGAGFPQATVAWTAVLGAMFIGVLAATSL